MLETLAGELSVHAADIAAVQVPLRPFANVNPFGAQIDAVGAINGFIADRLFAGQSPEFTELLLDLAHDADAARRQLD